MMTAAFSTFARPVPRRARVAALAGAASFSMLAGGAFAQTTGFERGEGAAPEFDRTRYTAVMQRSQPEYDPLPVHLGGTELFARLSGETYATDNELADNANKNADLRLSAAASVLDRYEWGANRVSVDARAGLRRFVDNGNDNNGFYGGGFGAVLNAGSPGRTVQFGASRSHDVLSRLWTESALTSTSQIKVDDTRAYVGGTVGDGALRLWLLGSYRGLRYSQPGAVSATDEFRDRDSYEGQAQLEYAVSGNLYGYAHLTADKRDFKLSGPSGNRNSTGLEASVGVNAETAALLRFDARVGYVSRRFDNPVYKDISGLTYAVETFWYPDELVTISARARRDVRDSSRIGVGAFVSDNAEVGADVEYRRNLIFSAKAGIGYDRYRGFDLAYKRLSSSLGALYRVSRNWQLQATASYDRRNSSGSVASRDFDVLGMLLSVNYLF